MTDWGVKRRELVRRSPEATCPGCFVTRHSYVFQVASPPGTANAPGSSSRVLTSVHRRLLPLVPNAARLCPWSDRDSDPDRPLPEPGRATRDTCGTGGGQGCDPGPGWSPRGCRTLRRPGCGWHCPAEQESGAPGGLTPISLCCYHDNAADGFMSFSMFYIVLMLSSEKSYM